MKEIWELSTTPWIMPLTIVLGFCVLYWLLNIVGFIDLDFLDVDLDADFDADVDTEGSGGSLTDGVLGSFLRFMNASDVPLMIILTILFLSMWSLNIIANASFNPDQANWLFGSIFVAVFIISVLIVKVVTMPLRPLFKIIRKGENDDEPVIGRDAIVVSLSLDERGGQVEIARENGAPALLSARLSSGDPVSRGGHVVLFDRDDATGIYLARRLDGETPTA